MTSDHELVLEWRREHHGDEVTGSYTALVKLIAKVRAAAVREALEEAARLADHHADLAQENDPDWNIGNWTEGMLASLPAAIRALMPGEKP